MRNNNKVPLGVANALLDEADGTLRHVFTAFIFHQFPQGIKDLCQSLEYIFKAFYCISFNDNNFDKLNHDVCKIVTEGNKEINKLFVNNQSEKNEITQRVLSNCSNKSIINNVAHKLSKSDISELTLDDLVNFFLKETTKKGDIKNKSEEMLNLYSINKSENEINNFLTLIRNDCAELHYFERKRFCEIPDEDIIRFYNTTGIGKTERIKHIDISMPSSRKEVERYRKKYMSTRNNRNLFHAFYSAVFSPELLVNILLHLSILIQEHKIPATYPDSEKYDTQTPNKIYTSRHPIIKCRFKLYRYTKKTLKYVRQFSKDKMLYDELLSKSKKRAKTRV